MKPNTGITRCIITVIFIILTSIQITAQNTKYSNGTGGNEQNPVRITVEGTTVSAENTQASNRLFFGAAPTLYVADGEKQVDQETPTRLEIYAENLNMLSNYEQRKTAASIEVLIIKVESPTASESKLSVEHLSSFINLKCILVLYNYNMCNDNIDAKSCIEKKVTTMVDKSVLEKFELYYLVSIDQ